MTPPPHAVAAELLRAALEDDSPMYVGGYEILEEIAQGGMGVVYRARCLHSGLIVALKMIRPGVFVDERALRLFLWEVQATAAAQHPHIVPLFSVGEHEGQPYYTMRLFKDSLASRLKDFRKPRHAAALIERVARAVQHAHDLGFLHLDLKPANVLIEKDEPYIADFGLARLAGAQLHPSTELPAWEPALAPAFRSGSRSYLGGGTPPYSSPEQESRGGPVTNASDIYSIGAMLYELLTQSPLDLDSTELLKTASARTFSRDLYLDLIAIARKCMERNPQQRYRSAADLADDVGRALRHEPTQARPLPAARRLLRMSLRRPALALLVLSAPVMFAGGLTILSRWTDEQVKNVLLSNGLAAKFAAGWILNQLGERMAYVQQIATDTQIAALASGPPQHDVEVLRPYQERGFGLVAVYDRNGVITALWPEGPANILGRDYAWRDYFGGACQAGEPQAPGAYAARAFQSENDGDYNLSISAPIIENGRCVGLVLASILTDSSLGPVRLVGQDNPRQKGVLVGPQDRRRGDPVGVFPRDYLLLIHDALQPAQGVSLPGDPALAALEERFGTPRPRGKQLELPDVTPLTTDRYRDPLDAEHRWLAAFYPVGGTGLVVGVQTRYDLIDRLMDFAIPALLCVVAAVLLLLFLRAARSSFALRETRRLQ